MYLRENDTPLVSVVIPAYNCEKFISSTLSSIISQNYNSFEIVIVDDNSTDNTVSIIRDFQLKFKNIFLISLQNNSGGPAKPRNIGVLYSKGCYIAFVDADDIWHIEKLKIQMDYLLSSHELAVCAVAQNFSDHDVVNTNTALSDYSISHLSYLSTLIKTRIPLSTLIIKKSVFDNLNFNEFRNFTGREDYLFCLDYLRKYQKIAKINQSLIFYRVQDRQLSSNKLKMLKRHFFVLFYHDSSSVYLFRFLKSLFYSVTHLLFSLFYRKLLRRL